MAINDCDPCACKPLTPYANNERSFWEAVLNILCNTYAIQQELLSAAGGDTENVFRGQNTVAPSQTDSVLVTAVPGKIIEVRAMFVDAAPSSSVTFKSKPAGAGTAITPIITDLPGEILPKNEDGWFRTVVGEALAVDTGANGGANTGFIYTYRLV